MSEEQSVTEALFREAALMLRKARNDTLEEAAAICERWQHMKGPDLAVIIRALKELP